MGMLDAAAGTAVETIVNKTFSAVGNRLTKAWDDYKTYTKRLNALKAFGAQLVGLTEAAAKQKTETAGLQFRVVRRNEKDYSFHGTITKRYDRIMVEVDQDKVTKSYLG